jgi:hypothetical protein
VSEQNLARASSFVFLCCRCEERHVKIDAMYRDLWIVQPSHTIMLE